jgi:predicted ribosome quality control (RQC) complex YloA/Tae2 family protein
VSLNWKEIQLILEELQLPACRIQNITQPDFHSIILELYRPGERFALYISLAQGKTRLHRLGRTIKRKVKLQRFAQFLRSRILGGRIVDTYQVGEERIIKMTIERAEETTVLWIRLWGGAANILATDPEGTILDCFYRRPRRGEVSGGFFDPEKDPSLLPASKGPHKQFEVRTIPGSQTFNEKIEKHYFDKEYEEQLQKVKKELLKRLSQRESKIASQLRDEKKKYRNYEQFEQYKQYGDLIASGSHHIQKGDRWFKTNNYYDDNNVIEIELQPDLSPIENAEAYYKKYKKAKSGLEKLEQEIENHEQGLAHLEREREEIEGSEDVNHLQSMLQSQKQNQEKKGEQESPLPGLRFTSHGFTILVGRNARENDELLRYHVRGNDVWLHTRDAPGGYVFIKAKSGKSVPLETLLDAGNLAVFYSKAKSSGQAELYYTQVKYLRRAKHGKTGLVIPTQEKNLSIDLDMDRIAQLQAG